MLYELENDLTPCHQANYPTCNLAISPCKFCDARSELKHVSPLIHGPPSFVLKLCASKTSRRRRKKRREIKLILSKVLINVVCESQNYVNNLILHSARFHFTVVVFWQKVSSNMATFRKQASQSKLSFEKVFRWNTVETRLRRCGVKISRKSLSAYLSRAVLGNLIFLLKILMLSHFSKKKNQEAHARPSNFFQARNEILQEVTTASLSICKYSSPKASTEKSSKLIQETNFSSESSPIILKVSF